MVTIVAALPSKAFAADGDAERAPDGEPAPYADPAPYGQAPPSKAPPNPPRTDLGPSDKRPVPDFDGLPDETTVGEDLLWIPRIIFFPAYIVMDGLVRRPLGALTMAVEENEVIPTVTSLFTYGDFGFVPTAFVDFGFRPSVGVYVFHDNFLAEGNDLRVSLATGGEHYFKAKVADRIPLGSRESKRYLQVEIDGLIRPDLLYWGTGSLTRHDDEGEFEIRTVGGGLRFHLPIVNESSFFEAWSLVRRLRFTNEIGELEDKIANEQAGFPSNYDDDSVYQRTLEGRYAAPIGFDGYTPQRNGLRFVVDSREKRPAPGSGVAVDVRAELGTDLEQNQGSWLSYAVSLGGFIDLTGTRRVLGFILDGRFVNGVGQDDVPFMELVGAKRYDDTPDDDFMRGFVPGRLLGRTGIAATVEYDWPIWAFLDGTMQAQIGNTFDGGNDRFALDRSRLSFVGGIRSPNSRDHAFNLLVGFGTRPISEGGEPESLRFLLGGTTGF